MKSFFDLDSSQRKKDEGIGYEVLTNETRKDERQGDGIYISHVSGEHGNILSNKKPIRKTGIHYVTLNIS